MHMPTSVSELFEKMLPALLQTHSQRAKELGGVYGFQLLGPNASSWTVDLKAEPATVKSGLASNVECTIVLTHEDFTELMKKPSLAMPLFLQGKLKVEGNPMLAMKIQKLFALADMSA